MNRITSEGKPVNESLLVQYLAPYGAYVTIAALAGSLPAELDYTLRIVVTAGFLFWFRKHYQPIAGPRSKLGSVLVGVVAGILGVLLWIALLLPFKEAADGDAVNASAFAFRLIAAISVVPLAEELLCRGYILGFVTQWQQAKRAGSKQPIADTLDRQSIHAITPGAATLLAVVVSAVAFAVGHAPVQWLAAFAYGVLMAGLWMLRRDLLTPIVAHATTNLVLYLYVYRSSSWGLW